MGSFVNQQLNMGRRDGTFNKLFILQAHESVAQLFSMPRFDPMTKG